MKNKILLKNIIEKETLIQYANELKKKRFSPGFDGMSAAGTASWIAINGNRLCRDILEGDYTPMPAICFYSAKASGGGRRLAKLTALDTVIQNVIRQTLSPYFDTFFSENSFAYRQGRGTTQAVEQYLCLANRYKFAARIDFTACYDNINHEKLLAVLGTFLADRALLGVLEQYIRMPVSEGGEVLTREKGILQGAPLSPLLCNVYFHTADCFLEEKGISFIRYADDLVLFADSLSEIETALMQTKQFFREELFLECHPGKTKILPPTELKFLGHKFKASKKGLIADEANADGEVDYFCNWSRKRPENNRRDIHLLSDGVLRQKEFSVLFDTDAQDSLIPPADLEHINVYSDVIFDSGFFRIAAKNGITVSLFDRDGIFLGSFVPDEHLKAPAVTHQQLLAYFDEKHRLLLAKEFLLASLHNCVLNIRYYHKQAPNAVYETALKKIEMLKKDIKQEECLNELLLEEAMVRQAYYDCYDLFVKKEGFAFEKRTQKPPQNRFNALLNFGNVVLCHFIAGELHKTALDVRVGFLHATNTRKQSLNLDLAEIFKPLLVDRAILSLINKGALSESDFSVSENGTVYLNQHGKGVFIKGFYSKLETTIAIKGENLSYRQIIRQEIQKLVRHFKNREKYKAFRQVR